MTELTKEIVRELLDYCPETGVLTWKWRELKWFTEKQRPLLSQVSWNKKYAGKPALTKVSSWGHLRGPILGSHYATHRVIWLWMTGEWPEQVDHINGVHSDNRWCNLRDVSMQENNRNRPLQKNNKSGVNGVTFRGDKWHARISNNGKRISLGSFATIEEAASARANADITFGYHENHGRKQQTLSRQGA